jgi:hypothetical protein
LFDVTARLKGGQQPKNIVLVKLQSLAQLGNADLINVSVELLENIEGVRYGLNYVIRFLPTNHLSSWLIVHVVNPNLTGTGHSKKAF